jgi:hypothetical protein
VALDQYPSRELMPGERRCAAAGPARVCLPGDRLHGTLVYQAADRGARSTPLCARLRLNASRASTRRLAAPARALGRLVARRHPQRQSPSPAADTAVTREDCRIATIAQEA